MQHPIYVIGSSNTDMVVKAHKLPAPGETVIGGSFLMNPGGKGANQAVAAARLNGKVALISKVGNDVFGRQAIQQFQRERINTQFVTIDTEHPSGVALINVDAKGENCITVAPGANGHLKPSDVGMALADIPAEAIVLLQLEIPLGTVEYAIRNCHKQGVRVLLNPAPAQTLPVDVFSCLYIITPNESEAEMLTGVTVTDEASADHAARKLQAMGVPNVIITLGAKGAYLLTESHAQLILTPAVTAIDTTAAGDCFNGALAVALSEEQTIEHAVAFACKAASISVTRMGAQSSIPHRREVDSLPLLVH